MQIAWSFRHFRNAIINVASVAGQGACAGLSTYCTTKFGVRGFTQSIGREPGSIKVYSVNPGTTATRMTIFQGTAPEKVAEIIVNAAKGMYKTGNGEDVNVFRMV